MNADDQFIIVCPACGKPVDKRNLSEVLSHGWIDPDKGKHECYIDVAAPDNTIAMKKGESVAWSGEKRIDLN
jgi:hypothetical protein